MSFLKPTKLQIGHLGAAKVKFKFNFVIHDLTLFEAGLKEAKIDPKSSENTFGVCENF
jgi:hypothetical protein